MIELWAMKKFPIYDELHGLFFYHYLYELRNSSIQSEILSFFSFFGSYSTNQSIFQKKKLNHSGAQRTSSSIVSFADRKIPVLFSHAEDRVTQIKKKFQWNIGLLIAIIHFADRYFHNSISKVTWVLFGQAFAEHMFSKTSTIQVPQAIIHLAIIKFRYCNRKGTQVLFRQAEGLSHLSAVMSLLYAALQLKLSALCRPPHYPALNIGSSAPLTPSEVKSR